MRRRRAICAWIALLAVLFAGPVGSLAECLRCPPDCPMHAASVEGASGDQPDPAHHAHHGHGTEGVETAARGDVHAAHADAHAGHHSDGDGTPEGGRKKCHEAPAPAPKPGDGPCLSGVCGHMDPSHARLLPDGVLRRPKPLAPVLLTSLPSPPDATPPAAREVAPPTEPPRAFSA